MAAGVTVIPELAVMDITAAQAMLTDVFGFRSDDTSANLVMRLGDQAIALVQADRPAGHGVMDHLALAVADLDQTLAQMRAQGAQLEATTPDGPREIAEFWQTGMRYVFLQGPEGARIELCARLGGSSRTGLPGHDHVGIPCTNIAASVTFWMDLGLEPISSVDLDRADGITHVRFLRAGESIVELYESPTLRNGPASFADNALWRGVRLENSGLPLGLRTGPDGLRVTVI